MKSARLSLMALTINNAHRANSNRYIACNKDLILSVSTCLSRPKAVARLLLWLLGVARRLELVCPWAFAAGKGAIDELLNCSTTLGMRSIMIGWSWRVGQAKWRCDC